MYIVRGVRSAVVCYEIRTWFQSVDERSRTPHDAFGKDYWLQLMHACWFMLRKNPQSSWVTE